MQNYERRHPRLIKKDEELQRLFDEAARRRKQILSNKSGITNIHIGNNLETQKYLLKPLRSTDDLKKERNLKICIVNKNIDINLRNAYQSCQNLPETNLDEFMADNDNNQGIICNDSQEPATNKQTEYLSTESITSPTESSIGKLNQTKQGYHNPNYTTSSFSTTSSSSSSSSSSALPPITSSISQKTELDSSKYCQFYPIKPPPTSSSYKATVSALKQPTSFDDGLLLDQSNSSQQIKTEFAKQNHSIGRTTRDSIYERSKRRPSSVYYYPSGSPLLSNKYQGSPVVRIDNKIRAGEADYLLNCIECDSPNITCIHNNNNDDPTPSSSNMTPQTLISIATPAGQSVPGKPPLLPHKLLLSSQHHSKKKFQMISALQNLSNSSSQPSLVLQSPLANNKNHEHQNVNKIGKSPCVVIQMKNDADINNDDVVDGGHVTASTSTLIKRRKKKLLEEQMNKRFSMGDFCTRPLIEWDSKLLLQIDNEQHNNQCHLPTSGDLSNCNDINGQLTNQSDYLYRASSCTTGGGGAIPPDIDETESAVATINNQLLLLTSQRNRYHANSESSIIQCNQCHSAESVSVERVNSATSQRSNNHHQVSFCERTKSADDDHDDDDGDRAKDDKKIRRGRPYHRHHYHHTRQRSISNFLQRSLNDLREVFRRRNNTLCSPPPVDYSVDNRAGSNNTLSTSKSNTRSKTGFQFRSFKKRQESITSDQLYSIPPFVRRITLAPDKSTTNNNPSTTQQQHNNNNTCSLSSSLSTNKSSSSNSSSNPPHNTPNLIAQLDPTYNHTQLRAAANQAETKRNRSCRLSFIENPQSTTVRKLTEAAEDYHCDVDNNNIEKPALCVVQPRRRTPPRSISSSNNKKNVRNHIKRLFK